MIKTILAVMLLIFAILGITEFIHNLKLSFLSKGLIKRNAIVVVLKEKSALEQLSFTYSQFRWHGPDYGDIIVGLTDNLSEDTINLCEEYAYKRRIALVPKEYLSNVVNSVF